MKSGKAEIKNSNKPRAQYSRKKKGKMIGLQHAHAMATEGKAIIQGKWFRSHVGAGEPLPSEVLHAIH